MENLEIEISGDIGYGASSKEYLSYLVKENQDKELVFRIASFGGDFNTALYIFSLIRNHKHKTTAIYEAGMSASAATIIACACDVRKANENALGLIHKVLTPVVEYGYMNEDDIKQTIENLESDLEDVKKMTVLLCNIYKSVMPKLSESEIMDLMKQEKWLTASEMVENGLVHSIEYDTVKIDTKAKNEMRMKFAASVTAKNLPPLPKAFLNTKKEKMNLFETIKNYFKNTLSLSDDDANTKANDFAMTINEAVKNDVDAKVKQSVAKLDIVKTDVFDSLQERFKAMQQTVESLQEKTVDLTAINKRFEGFESSIAEKDKNIVELNKTIEGLKNTVGAMQIGGAKFQGENNGKKTFAGQNPTHNEGQDIINFFQGGFK